MTGRTNAAEALARDAEHIRLIAMSHQDLVDEILRLRSVQTEELRNSVLEEAADLCDRKLDCFSGTECTYRCDVAEAIRELKRTVSPRGK